MAARCEIMLRASDELPTHRSAKRRRNGRVCLILAARMSLEILTSGAARTSQPLNLPLQSDGARLADG
eukprot:3962973-Pyramimonas_sp.AAC.1